VIAKTVDERNVGDRGTSLLRDGFGRAPNCDRQGLPSRRRAAVLTPRSPALPNLAPPPAWHGLGADRQIVGQRNLATTANTYSHVLMDETEVDYAALLAGA
jgi:hypothetical protein